MVKGNFYNWKNQPERLVYLGKMDAWHRFALVDEPYKVWCEVLDEDLHMLEETVCDKSTPQGRHNSHRGLRGSAPRVSHGPGTIGSNPCSEIPLQSEDVEDVPSLTMEYRALTVEYRVANADGVNATPAYSLEYARGQQEVRSAQGVPCRIESRVVSDWEAV